MELREVLKLLAEGEGQRVEFKERPSQLGEEICAFANSGGGYIFVGVRDDGEIVGTDAEKVKRTLGALMLNIRPPVHVDVDVVEIQGKQIVVIEVPPSDKIHTIGGRAYVRIGNAKRPLDISELLARGAEFALLSVDQTLTELTVEDLWEEALEKYVRALRERGMDVDDVLKHLEKIGLVRKGRLTLAAVLLFTEAPQERFPHTYVRFYEGEAWTRIGGPIWLQVERTVFRVVEALPKVEVYGDVERKDVTPVPLEAIREAVVNALVHRNYADFAETFIEVGPKRLRVWNPGGFPPGVTPERPFPRPRNPLIYERMFEMGYVERRGRGIELIRRTCEAAGVSVTIDSQAEYTEVTFTWGRMDPRVEAVLGVLSGPMRAREVAARLGVSLPTALKYLKLAEKAGYVKRMGKGPATRWVPNR